jgi:hypothetical protein
MLRWIVRALVVVVVLFVGANSHNFLAVVLGYVLWLYLVWAAWPRLRADFRRVWFFGRSLREDRRFWRSQLTKTDSGF